MSLPTLPLAATLLLSHFSPGLAVPPDAPVEPAHDAEIVVTAPRIERDQAIGDAEPDISLGQQEIATYGAATIGELMEQLQPQTGQKPIVLINGKRISNPLEILRLPPEAVERIDILPEEVALTYGYPAGQKVVNFVLVRRLNSITVNAQETLPTEGGRADGDISLNLLRIAGSARTSFDLSYSRASKLTEAERDLPTADAPFRTLMPSAESLSIGTTLARPLTPGVDTTITATLDRRNGSSLNGLAANSLALMPLAERTRSTGFRLGAVLNGRLSPFSWTLTGGFDHGYSVTLTDQSAPAVINAGASRDRVRSISNTLSGEALLQGVIARLPAGPAGTTIQGGITRSVQQNEGARGGTPFALDTATTQSRLSANIQIPITSRRENILGALGNLSANLNVAHEGLSGTGSADSLSYGLNWVPSKRLFITANLRDIGGLPPQLQRDTPIIITPNVPIYDLVRGETVLASRVDGGNPALVPERRHALSATANLKPFEAINFALNLDYKRSRSSDQLGALPAATAAVEAAFPERFVRDPSGTLVQVDARPVNFKRARQEQLSWGIFWSQSMGAPSGTTDAQAADQNPIETNSEVAGDSSTADPVTESGTGVSGSKPDGMKPGQGKFVLSLNHVWRIRNDLLVREGLPSLDLLRGDGVGGRGKARHQVNARANVTMNGLGLTVDASWQSRSRAKGSSTTLTFSDLFTVDTRLFLNLGQLSPRAGQSPLLKGARLSLDIDNVFAARIKVRDQLGTTPLGYSGAYLDPLGRSVKLSLRKIF